LKRGEDGKGERGRKGDGRVVVPTVEGEALDDCPDDHDARTEHDTPSSTKGVVDDGDEGETEDGTERESCCEDAAVGAGGVAKVCLSSLVRMLGWDQVLRKFQDSYNPSRRGEAGPR